MVRVHSSMQIDQNTIDRPSPHSTPAEPNPQATSSRVQCYSSFLELAPYRDSWNRLVEEVGGDLFGSFEWCSTWWRHFGRNRDLRIFVAWDGDRMVGALPLFVDMLRWGPISLQMMRSVGSDYAGARSFWCVKEEFFRQVAEAVYSDFCESGCDLLYIGEWPGYFHAAPGVAEAFRELAGNDNVVHAANYYPQAVFDLAGDADAYLATLSPSERSNIRKSLRRLQDTPDARFECVSANDLDQHFAAFSAQHELLWAKRGRLGFFRDWPGSEAFHRDLSHQLAAEGRLLLIRFCVGEETLGYEYALRFGRRSHMFQSSRSNDSRWEPLSPGRLLHYELEKQSIAAGMKQIDGLSGFYEFKRRLGARFIGLQSLAVFSPKPRSHFRAKVFRKTTSAIETAYFRMWFWHFSPWMRLRLPHLSKYIPGSGGLLRKFVQSRLIIPALGDTYDEVVLKDDVNSREDSSRENSST